MNCEVGKKKKGRVLKTEWLYQVRIKVSNELSDALRARKLVGTSKKIFQIAEMHGTIPVCTYDAFCDYCTEAEENGIEKYSLYDWTKQTIEDPEKKEKHIKSFAFYTEDSQIYEESLARLLHNDLLTLHQNDLIEDLKLIDSNPKNNPQPPKKE